MEGVIIFLFGCLLAFVLAAFFGAKQVNHQKTLKYGLIMLIMSVVIFGISGIIFAILSNGGRDVSASVGAVFVLVEIASFLGAAFGMGLIIGAGIQSVSKNHLKK